MRETTKTETKKQRRPEMRIALLPVNQCWVVLLGDTIVDLDGQSLFNDLDDLKWVLRLKGLKLAGRKIVPIGHPFGSE
jgi:hypothetical protein